VVSIDEEAVVAERFCSVSGETAGVVHAVSRETVSNTMVFGFIMSTFSSNGIV
jgi:hypothetical protein